MGTTMTPLRCYENNLFQKFLFTRGYAASWNNRRLQRYIADRCNKKSTLVAPLCGATHHPALCAIFK